MDKLLIGLDFGSDSVRALLVTSHGKVLASSVHAYSRWQQGLYCNAAQSQFRQHPLDYLEGTEAVIKGVLKGQDAAKVVGIGVDTTGSTPCAVNKDGTPLALTGEFATNPNAMFVLWKDHTALDEAVRINQVAKSSPVDYTMYEGGIYSPEWFWSKVLHVLKVDEKVRNAAASFVEHCDWMTSELSGSPVKPSRCAAGHKAMFHPSWGGLPPNEFLVKVDPLLDGWRDKLYKETYTADVPVGKLSAKWAQKLGLSTDVVISGSAFDCHAGAVGAGIEPGELIKVIGTSTCDILITPSIDKCVRGICGQVDGSVVPGMIGLEAGQSAFGDVYAWFKRFMSYKSDISLPELEADAVQIPMGSTGIIALDWFNGRRTPDANPHLAGAIFGLNLGSTAPMVYRALVESTACGARRIVERFISEGVAVNEIGAIGGIARKSPFIMQTCADIINKPIRISESDQACALGAAIFAAVAAGVYPDTEAAMSVMSAKYDIVYTPNPAQAKLGEELYQQYCSYADLVEKEVNSRLA